MKRSLESLISSGCNRPSKKTRAIAWVFSFLWLVFITKDLLFQSESSVGNSGFISRDFSPFNNSAFTIDESLSATGVCDSVVDGSGFGPVCSGAVSAFSELSLFFSSGDCCSFFASVESFFSGFGLPNSEP